MLKRVRATFAYFTASVTGNQSASSVIVNAAQIGTITYDNGNELNLDNALPGTEKQIKFTVSSDVSSNVGVKYSIKWTGVSNNFSTKGDLVYTLEGQVTSQHTPGQGSVVAKVDSGNAPENDTIVGSGIIMPGEKHNYTLTLKFKETGSDQTSLQGKTFSGKIEVTTGDESGSSVYYNASNSSGTTSKP